MREQRILAREGMPWNHHSVVAHLSSAETNAVCRQIGGYALRTRSFMVNTRDLMDKRWEAIIWDSHSESVGASTSGRKRRVLPVVSS